MDLANPYCGTIPKQNKCPDGTEKVSTKMGYKSHGTSTFKGSSEKLKQSDDNFCRKCLKGKETRNHILC